MSSFKSEIIGLTCDFNEIIPLRISVTKKIFNEKVESLSERFTLIYDNTYTIEKDFLESIHNALTACISFLENWPQKIIDEFEQAHFFIKIDHLDSSNTALQFVGESAGLAFALSIISCFFEIEFFTDIAVTGKIDINGNVSFVENIKEKVASLIDNKKYSYFLIPPLKTSDEEFINKKAEAVYAFLNKVLSEKIQIVLQCHHFKQAIICMLNGNGYVRVYKIIIDAYQLETIYDLDQFYTEVIPFDVKFIEKIHLRGFDFKYKYAKISIVDRIVADLKQRGIISPPFRNYKFGEFKPNLVADKDAELRLKMIYESIAAAPDFWNDKI